MSTLDISKAAELLLENFYTVSVAFNWVSLKASGENHPAPGDKSYTYKVHKSLKLQKGDIVLARANNEIKMVLVVDVHSETEIDYGANFKYKWVFQKVDFAALEKLEELDRRVVKSIEVVERRRKKRELLKELKADMTEEDLKILTEGLDLPLLEPSQE